MLSLALTPVDLLCLGALTCPVYPAQVRKTTRRRPSRTHSGIVSQPARPRLKARERRDLPNHVLIPGFINRPRHAAMSLFRGWPMTALMTG